MQVWLDLRQLWHVSGSCFGGVVSLGGEGSGEVEISVSQTEPQQEEEPEFRATGAVELFLPVLVRVEPHLRFQLSLDAKSSALALTNTLLHGYDSQGQPLEVVPFLRKRATGCVIAEINDQHRYIKVVDPTVVASYEPVHAQAHSRSLAYYPLGDLDAMPSSDDVLPGHAHHDDPGDVRHEDGLSYSTNPLNGAYRQLDIPGGRIYLTESAWQALQAIRPRLVVGRSMIANHRSGGTYTYPAALSLGPEWTVLKAEQPLEILDLRVWAAADDTGGLNNNLRPGCCFVQAGVLFNLSTLSCPPVDSDAQLEARNFIFCSLLP